MNDEPNDRSRPRPWQRLDTTPWRWLVGPALVIIGVLLIVAATWW